MSQGSDAGRHSEIILTLKKEHRTGCLLPEVGNFSLLRQPEKCMSDIKMQFSASNADVPRQMSQAALAASSGPAFLSLLVKAVFNTYSKYQPNWLLGRRVFPCKWSLTLHCGPAAAGCTA